MMATDRPVAAIGAATLALAWADLLDGRLNDLAPFAFAAEIFRSGAPERLQDISTYESLYARGLLD